MLISTLSFVLIILSCVLASFLIAYCIYSFKNYYTVESEVKLDNGEKRFYPLGVFGTFKAASKTAIDVQEFADGYAPESSHVTIHLSKLDPNPLKIMRKAIDDCSNQTGE